MAIDHHASVLLLMGFSSPAGKLQKTDRIRGIQNSYLTVSHVMHSVEDGLEIILDNGTSLCVSYDQMLLSMAGWKHASSLVKEEWLVGNGEDELLEITEIRQVKTLKLVNVYSEVSGTFLANGVLVASSFDKCVS